MAAPSTSSNTTTQKKYPEEIDAAVSEIKASITIIDKKTTFISTYQQFDYHTLFSLWKALLTLASLLTTVAKTKVQALIAKIYKDKTQERPYPYILSNLNELRTGLVESLVNQADKNEAFYFIETANKLTTTRNIRLKTPSKNKRPVSIDFLAHYGKIREQLLLVRRGIDFYSVSCKPTSTINNQPMENAIYSIEKFLYRWLVSELVIDPDKLTYPKPTKPKTSYFNLSTTSYRGNRTDSPTTKLQRNINLYRIKVIKTLYTKVKCEDEEKIRTGLETLLQSCLTNTQSINKIVSTFLTQDFPQMVKDQIARPNTAPVKKSKRFFNFPNLFKTTKSSSLNNIDQLLDGKISKFKKFLEVLQIKDPERKLDKAQETMDRLAHDLGTSF